MGPNGRPLAGRPYRTAREALELAASIRRVAYAVAAGFAAVMLLAAWWS